MFDQASVLPTSNANAVTSAITDTIFLLVDIVVTTSFQILFCFL